MLDSSKLRELLVKDQTNASRKKLAQPKASPSKQALAIRKPASTKLVFGTKRRNMRTYRHKSEMVGDIVKAQKDYEDTKKQLNNSEIELEELKRQAKVASAKASVAKIKIKALLVLMRKMIAYSVNSDSDGSKLLFEPEAKNAGDGVSHIIEAKLHNIATMIPQYNASLQEATELASRASRLSGSMTGNGEMLPQQQYDQVLQRLMRMEASSTDASPGLARAIAPSAMDPPSFGEAFGEPEASSKAPPSTQLPYNEEEAWNNLIAKIQSEDMA